MGHPEVPEGLGVETEGVTQVGEIITRVMREAITEPDFANARAAAAGRAYHRVLAHSIELRALAGPYDDVRALESLESWLKDRIAEVHATESNGST
jgi:hypothetical protein